MDTYGYIIYICISIYIYTKLSWMDIKKMLFTSVQLRGTKDEGIGGGGKGEPPRKKRRERGGSFCGVYLNSFPFVIYMCII